jgi:anti-sigma regulatory factor (Ser/Thr protein kinase)
MAGEFVHSVLIIESDRTAREVLVPAARRALDQTDSVVAALTPATAAVLHDALGHQAERLDWQEPDYQRMGLAYESFRRLLAGLAAAGRTVQLFAEPVLAGSNGSAAERANAYLAYEAVGNETYAGPGHHVTCLWDSRHHPDEVIADVRRVHSHETTADGHQINEEFVAAEEYLAGRPARPLPLPGRKDWHVTVSSTAGLADVRHAIEKWGAANGLPLAVTTDAVLAANEVAANGLIHGRPPVTVTGWREARSWKVQVDDSGGRRIPATAGYRPPTGLRQGGYGMWLARQLADVVHVYTAGSTTSVRLHFPGW